MKFGISWFALMAVTAASKAYGADYVVTTETELRDAIIAANNSGDSESTITLAADIDLLGAEGFADALRPISIDTAGYSLTARPAGTSGAGSSLVLGGQNVTVSGGLFGGSGGTYDTNASGGTGLSFNGALLNVLGDVSGGAGGNTITGGSNGRTAGQGGSGVAASGASVINSGNILGGAGGSHNTNGNAGTSLASYAGRGGVGVELTDGALHNTGVISGGRGGDRIGGGGSDNSYGGAGGVGAQLTGGTHINDGDILGGVAGAGRNAGGASGNGAGGMGAFVEGGAHLVNNGTIRGANGRSGGGGVGGRGSAAGAGVRVVDSVLENYGEIEGGKTGSTGGAANQGVATGVTGQNSTIINDGTISAGLTGANNRLQAIAFTGGGNNLELWSNSSILGYVSAGATDRLLLGGATNSSFDVSAIGAAAQFRGFGLYEKSGGSVWELTGTTSDLTPWTLTGGTLQISADDNLGRADGSLSFNGGVLRTTADISSGRNFIFNNTGSIHTDAGTVLTLDGDISGAGGFSKLGAGRLVLLSQAMHAGTTTVSGGILQLGDGGTDGGLTGNIANNAELIFNRSDDLGIEGIISGTGIVRQSGAGRTSLTGENTYTGLTYIDDGVLEIGDGGTTGRVVGNIVNNGDLIFNRAGTLAYAGAITGNGDVYQVGSGTTRLTGVNNYGGDTVIAAGSLEVRNSGRLSTGGDILVGAMQGTFGVTGDPVSTLSVLGAGSEVTTSGRAEVGQSSDGVLNISNGGQLHADDIIVGAGVGISGEINIEGAGATLRSVRTPSAQNIIGQNGSGALNILNGGQAFFADDVVFGAAAGSSGIATVSGLNSVLNVEGNIEVERGALRLVNGARTVLSDGNGELILSDASLLIGGQSGDVEAGAGTLDAAHVSTGSMALVNFNHNTEGYVFAAEMSGAGRINHEGSGVTSLTANNSYSGGTTVSEGTLLLGNGGTTGALLGDVSNDGTFGFNRSNALTFGGVISGDGSLLQRGAGVTTLTANNTYTGGTVIEAGTLRLGNGSSSGWILGDVDNRSVLDFRRSDDVVFSGVVSGAGELVQSGAGLLTFTSNQTYSGGTRITSGGLSLGDGFTGGWILGDVENDGDLIFNRSDNRSFTGLVSGLGNVHQNGSGVTTLTQDNAYLGQTFVNAGTLRINGDQSLATGLTTVSLGATLGGNGIVGGNVIVTGGTIAPGNSPGVLTINGDLSLDAASLLDFEFGEADVEGGPLNDLIIVGGDLTLDGTIDVTLTPGGEFGPGIYRVISFGGSLTDQTLDIGTVPAGQSVSVQTSVVQQVNLVNTTGYAFRYWDVFSGMDRDNGLLEGGTGIWYAAAGNDYWTTDETATLNAGFSNTSFAVFAAAPGIVTIDNSLGDVEASGLQFASDGYVITGDALTLSGGAPIIRVGDGTLAGGDFTATIESETVGSNGLVKSDLGTLILEADNSYTGGTVITAGALQLGAGGTTGSVSGDVVNDGALAFNRHDSVSFDHVISGSGRLVQIGAGTLTLTADNTYTGGTQIAAGSSLQIGNGGAAGWVEGNVVNDGLLAFDRSDANTFAGIISGDGGLEKLGVGELILTGASSYLGDTRVEAGTLFVNGDQSLATGTTHVASGARLGGVGTLGGDVVVNNGGVLAPGANSVGGLSIEGSLVLSDASLLDFEFGEAGVVGGALNDVIHVGGNLTLDGILDVTIPAGGNFDRGIYRVINYDGSLTNNGLSLGSVPVGSTSFVQTSINGQVNLVNTAGDVFSFWDGEAGPKNSGLINGGDGIWQAVGSRDNWTDANGDLNAAFSDASFAVFSAEAGNVTVDRSLGDVRVIGMQFASDGYNISGDAIDLVGIDAEVRVGDGSGAGVGYVATIESQLEGASRLLKTEAGTLILSGANTYAGGTAVHGGVLQISDDRNLGQAGTGIELNAGTLHAADNIITDRTVTLVDSGTLAVSMDSELILESAVIGAGAFTKAEVGTLVLLADNTYTGGTTISGGKLQLGNGGTSGAILGNVENNGVLEFNRADDVIFEGLISGGGELVQAGAGHLILSADNTYSGGTRIEAGALQLGDGGRTGSVLGDILNNGALIINRADEVELAGLISGTGGLRNEGQGILILTGNNTYTGTTDVHHGMLIIDGDQTFATGLTSVSELASLGGTGVIGGDVTVQGVLDPGSADGAPGTLTINGALNLAPEARLAFQFGAADIAGGALNDLVNIGQDLTLDGTLDVTVSSMGEFSAGIYRVFNYGGGLTDNGLELGAMPDGSELFVQTAVANQVNLVNTAGMLLNVWDGPAGTKNNSGIEGGDGVWRLGDGENDWTDINGRINADYANGSFVIFQGNAGIVQVDNTYGDVISAGMQFAANGYEISGEPLTLTGAVADIRVGDGSAAGAEYTATISAELTGQSALRKVDAGTLILTGSNTYTGGTQITGGTLQVSRDANLGAADGSIGIDNATLYTDESFSSDRTLLMTGAGTIRTEGETALTLTQAVSGSGELLKTGQGRLNLTGDSASYAAGISLLQGVLGVDGRVGSIIDVADGARLEGAGIVGGILNEGVVAPGGEGLAALTVSGNYVGHGGILEIEAVLGGDQSPADRLIVNGDTSGNTTVSVLNRGGMGDYTIEGIRIIDVEGDSGGAFFLNGDYVFEGDQAVISGAYAYRLYKNGVSDPADGNWYLRSTSLNEPDGGTEEPAQPLYQPGVPLYEALAGAQLELNRVPTLQQRVGNRFWGARAVQSDHGIWGRVEASRAGRSMDGSASQMSRKTESMKMQAGADFMLHRYETGAELVGGVTAQYAASDSRVRSVFGNGSLDAEAYGVGATVTWYAPDGTYVDWQFQRNWLENDLQSDVLGRVTESADGHSGIVSLEAGRLVSLGQTLSATPQVQVSYTNINLDGFRDAYQAYVTAEQADNLVTRLGFTLDHQQTVERSAGEAHRRHVYGIANLNYEWLGGTVIDVSGADLKNRPGRLWGEIGLGGSFSWKNDRFAIYTEVSGETDLSDFGDNYVVKATAGMRFRF